MSHGSCLKDGFVGISPTTGYSPRRGPSVCCRSPPIEDKPLQPSVCGPRKSYLAVRGGRPGRTARTVDCVLCVGRFSPDCMYSYTYAQLRATSGSGPECGSYVMCTVLYRYKYVWMSISVLCFCNVTQYRLWCFACLVDRAVGRCVLCHRKAVSVTNRYLRTYSMSYCICIL
jgi:hypothetical protein